MTIRELLRPWPLFLLALFGAVAIVDLVHTLREEKPSPPDLVQAGAVQFTRREPVFEPSGGSSDPEIPIRPVRVDPDGDRLVINSAGRLRIPFVLDDRTDALQLRYRFSTGSGVAELQVARPDGAGEGLDAIVRRTLSAEQRRSGRVRVPLHGRRGDFVLLVDFNPGPVSGRLKLTSMKLVKEGDPTLRRR